jgi:hypothetical protein
MSLLEHIKLLLRDLKKTLIYKSLNIDMKLLTKKDIQTIYNRCLSLVRRKPAEFFIFKKLKICGWCLYDEDAVVIDHRKDMLRTAYHELIHYLYPDWSETQVIYAESRIVNGVSILDNARFLKMLSVKTYECALLKERRARRKKKKLKKYDARNKRSS